MLLSKFFPSTVQKIMTDYESSLEQLENITELLLEQLNTHCILTKILTQLNKNYDNIKDIINKYNNEDYDNISHIIEILNNLCNNEIDNLSAHHVVKEKLNNLKILYQEKIEFNIQQCYTFNEHFNNVRKILKYKYLPISPNLLWYINNYYKKIK